MHFIIWNYTVEASNQAAFQQEYGRSGAWFKLFETCDDYLGTDLLKNGTTFMVIDKWISKEAYEEFMADCKTEYDQINTKSKGLYKDEQRVGEFETVGF